MSRLTHCKRNSPACVSFAAAFLAAVLFGPVAANGQGGTQRGATWGGLAGAVAGGLIGDHNDNAGAGAAIGGIIGAVSGGILGNAADKERAAYQNQQYYQQQQQQIIQTQGAVSVTDVISMSRSGLSDSVIVNQIQQRGVIQELQVPDIIALHQQGVRENVITAMQRASIGSQAVAAGPQTVYRERVLTPAPVIVEEHYVVPHYGPPRPLYYHRVPRYHHHGIHVRF